MYISPRTGAPLPPAGRGHVDGKHVHYGKIYWIFASFREIYMKNTLNFPYQDQNPVILPYMVRGLMFTGPLKTVTLGENNG